MTHILFTGGGSAGHVTPNIALICEAQKRGWKVSYAGTHGIEATLIAPLHIPYYIIDSGKLKRQKAWSNLLTPFKVLRGIWQAFCLCHRIKPDLVFSKGGFVAVPTVIGAWLNHIPIISHESDLTPGLANRLSYPFSKKIALTFQQSVVYFKNQKKLVHTGTPIRAELLKGNAEAGKTFLHFETHRPIILIYGGGSGSVTINHAVWEALPQLLPQFNIVHCCGKGKTNTKYNNLAGYRQFDYLNEPLANVMVAASLVISRAGANSIVELLTLQKPHLLIPLSKKVSRGDQIDNAIYCEKEGLSMVLQEEQLTPTTLVASVEALWKEHKNYEKKLSQYVLPNAIEKLIALMSKVMS